MVEKTKSRQLNQFTGNSALNYAAWQLSRRGWHVMPTIRNARGSDLIVTNADETKIFGVQSKGLSRQYPVPLGLSLESLRSHWWVITINVNSDSPTCYVLKLEEICDLAVQDKTGKNGRKWWLAPKDYVRDEFREAWKRLELPVLAP